MKYGIIINDKLICDPITDHSLLESITQRHGFLVNTPFKQNVEIVIAGKKLLIVPGVEERPQPPALTGYRGALTSWQYEPSYPRLLRTITYTQLPFDEAVADTLNHIAEQQDEALARIEQGYTEQEVKTWAQQQAEAAAWTADNTAPVPLIEGLTLRRSVSVRQIVAKINEKVSTAAALTGIVLGDAQAAGDQIDSLKALYASDALPEDWFDRLQTIAAGWRKDWPSELL